jgi:hypothetical protein
VFRVVASEVNAIDERLDENNGVAEESHLEHWGNTSRRSRCEILGSL